MKLKQKIKIRLAEFRQSVKEKCQRQTQKVINRWHKIQEPKRKIILSFVEEFLNYLIASVLLAFPIYFFSLIFFNSSIIRYFMIQFSLLVIFPYMEHYYIWFKERWKDNLIEKD